MNQLFKILLFCFLFTNSCFGQNLVPNPSFENFINCPNGASQIDSCQNWYQPTTATPDYFNSCFDTMQPWSSIVDVPTNNLGYQNAKSGNAYAGFAVSETVTWSGNYREYLSVRLIDSLVSGMDYYFSCWVSLADSSRYATDSGIGFFFSNDSIYQSNYDTINVVPQIINPLGNFITDKTNWIPIQGIFTAIGGEKYLTIGNFNDYSNSDTISVLGGGNPSYYNLPYYYIDDVCLSVDSNTCSVSTSIEKNIEINNITIFPNPSNGKFSIKTSNIDSYSYNKNQLNSVEILSITGSKLTTLKIPSKSLSNISIDLSNMPDGVYLLKGIFDNSYIIKKIIITNP